MDDHSKHSKGVREGYSQYNTSPVPANNGVGGASSSKGQPVAENLPPSSNADETQVNNDLLNAWMQRLQVLTVVTTFLASMDGTLFSLSALNTQIGLPTSTTPREVVYCCLSGALIFHICACMLGYVASFALIRYRIVDAEDDAKVEASGLGGARPAQHLPRRIVCEPVRPRHLFLNFLQRPEGFRFLFGSGSSSTPPPPPLSLLTHCYYTTLCLTTVGFILALVGILAYAWVGLPMLVGIFSTVCLGVGISAAVWAIAM